MRTVLKHYFASFCVFDFFALGPKKQLTYFSSGVFRADIPIKFRVTPSAFQTLIDEAEETMKFSIEKEEKIPMEYVTNFDEV